MNRGDRRERIKDGVDRERFLAVVVWTEKKFSRRAKGDKAKAALAWRLRAEITMNLRWIARRLQMGAWTYVANLLREPAKN